MKKYFLFIFLLVIFIGTAFSVNWLYHAWKNPAIILNHFRSLSGNSWKSPNKTWEQYGDLFLSHETSTMRAEFLAAIAQNESAGNTTATTYWRWKWSSNPFEIYAPASSSVGLYQYTKGTFEDAKRFCVHWGEPTLDGKWYEWSSCWFNGFYSRLIPSNSIEITAARLQFYVDQQTSEITASEEEKRKLATVIHLCGKGKARKLIQARFQIEKIGSCGSHSPKAYYHRIDKLRKQFSKLRRH